MQFFKKGFMYLFDREHSRGGAEEVEEADSPLSRETDAKLDPGTPRWWPELKTDV